MKLAGYYGCLLAGLIVSACVARPSAQTTPEAPTISTSQQTASPGNIPTGIFDEHSEGAKKAWDRFTEGGRYRVARAKDFDIPKAATENDDLRRDIERATKFAYVGEDINRDGLGRDRAFIVVNTTRSDARRYSLVIFNELEDERTIPEPCWVYRDTDLSRTVMFWVRGELTLRAYRADGTYGLCSIKWDERRKQYSCE